MNNYPFNILRHMSFWDAVTLESNGGGGGGGGNSNNNPPAKISNSYSKDKETVNATTAAANEKFGGGYQTASTYNAEKGGWGYSTIKTPASGSDKDTPAPVASTPADTPIIEKVEEPAPAAPTPAPTPAPVASAPSAPAPTPSAPPPATIPTPDTSFARPRTETIQVRPPEYAAPATQVLPSNPRAGTFATPLQTAGLSAVPKEVTVKTHYAGTTGMVDPTLTTTSQGVGTIENVRYQNSIGQQVFVTEVNGQPTTYVPPGFTKVQSATGMAEGGMVDRTLQAELQMARRFLNYQGPDSRRALDTFIASNPGASARMGKYRKAMMARGGLVGMAEGGAVTDPNKMAQMSSNLIGQTMQPIQSNVAFIKPEAADFIPVDAGQAVPVAPFAEAATAQTVQQAELPVMTPSALMQAATVTPQVQAQTAATQAQQGQVSQQAQVQAAQQTGPTAVSQLEAAQGNAFLMNNPVQRQIQAGELISGSSVDAAKVEQLNASIQAAEATPTEQATVQGQMANLMQQFEGGKTPAWAAGAMRNATAMLSARGLGASSLAGQAVIQAAMESALPIAQVDAQTRAQFESQNLSNRQQTAMLAAQQRAQFLQIEFDQDFQARVQNSARIGDIANMNFTAEQQIALENSRAVNTMNLQNLNNRQAKVMAEAAALANLEITNLNNRQQAAVQNAQAFLQMDMTNLSNAQQTELFKAQQNIQALFTDQAAENASRQFNAANENQTNQFFANLTTQTAQFNASQQNAMDQFNLNSVNAMRQFNSEVQQQRDLFNAQNGLIIAQANAQWRQNIATLNTAAQNESNAEFARTLNAMTATNLDQVWQRERDIMAYVFTALESEKDRALDLLLADKKEKFAEDAAQGALFAELVKDWIS